MTETKDDAVDGRLYSKMAAVVATSRLKDQGARYYRKWPTAEKGVHVVIRQLLAEGQTYGSCLCRRLTPTLSPQGGERGKSVHALCRSGSSLPVGAPGARQV